MKEKKYLNYINFTPFKLKVFKSENFSIHRTPIKNKHKTSFSYINIKRFDNPVLIRNPTHNFLFDKINVDNLSTSKYLINKSIKNENSFINTNNNNSKSVDNNIIRINKTRKYKTKSNNYFQNNNNYYNNYKTKTPIKISVKINKNKTFENYYKKKNTNPFSNDIISQNNKYKIKNKYLGYLNIENKKEKEQKIKKIILIQSFWRSYFLRKLVVGGLEKYYSSIAMSKYLDNIFIRNKKILFKYFIGLIKDYALQKKYSCFNYRTNKNNINIFFKGNEDLINSFEIPSDRKKDCINFFIKREQIKSNKKKIINNKNFINKKKANNINIKDYNWKNDIKSRNNTNKMISLYNKKNKKENCKNNINIKINLINHNNINDNNKIRNNKTFSSDNIIKNNLKNIYKNKINVNQRKKIFNEFKPKKIYSKKIIGDENAINSLKKDASFSSFNRNNIKNKIKIKKLLLNINKIKKKFFKLYFHFFINNMKIQIKNNNKRKFDFLKIIYIVNKKKLKAYFNIFKNKSLLSKNNNKYDKVKHNSQLFSIFPKRNVIYYKKKNSKYNHAKLKNDTKTNNEYHKIKVNKNNQIEKNKKLKLLKKILSNKINYNLNKYFLKWKNFSNNNIPFVHFNFDTNKKYNNGRSQYLNRQKSENPNKRHIKIKYKKSYTNFNTISTNSYDKKHTLSKSCKKMKISKVIYNNNNIFFSTLSSDLNIKCKENLMNKISKKDDILFNKVISLIKIIEKKNILYKFFIEWKKESKKKC